MKTTVTPGVSNVSMRGHGPGISVFHFVGLMRVAEFSARQARLNTGLPTETPHAINATLAAHAALEALSLETAFLLHPTLYEKKRFRRDGLGTRLKAFLEQDGRPAEPMPDVIDELLGHRNALTHSEPDHVRSTQVGAILNAAAAERFAREVRNVALWLWNGRTPRPVASEFDEPNIYV